MSFSGKGMELESIMLIEINQFHKDISGPGSMAQVVDCLPA
jgi:hypothetical protein